MKHLFAALLLSASPAIAEDAHQTRANELCAAIADDPVLDYEGTFADVARAAVSREQLTAYFAGFTRAFGACTGATVDPAASFFQARSVRLTSASGATLQAALVLAQDARVAGFEITRADDPRFVSPTAADLVAALAALDGDATIYLAPNDAPTSAIALAADAPFAIGSTFKLWILGAVHDRIAKGADWTWDTPLLIKDEWKSIPSGVLQDVPAGTPITVREMALKMISISDNTGTDHLLRYLGREVVEASARSMGLANTHRGNLPLLTTLEAFKLKWTYEKPTLGARYIAATTSERATLLGEIAAIPRTQVCPDGLCVLAPKLIDEIEWFATTRETCAAITSLTARHDGMVDAILGANTPFLAVGPGTPWAYAGFKGGSEPGVFHLTYALRTQDGREGCLSLGFNDGSRDAYAGSAREVRFLMLARGALELAESVLTR